MKHRNHITFQGYFNLSGYLIEGVKTFNRQTKGNIIHEGIFD